MNSYELKSSDNSDLDEKIISEQDVKHLIPKIRYYFSILEKNVSKVLFNEKRKIKPDNLVESFRDNFLFNKNDAILLTKFILENNNNSPLRKDKEKYMRTEKIYKGLQKLVGTYKKTLDESVSYVVYDYKNYKDKSQKKNLINKITEMCDRDYINPIELSGLITEHGLKILLRKSLSVCQINSKVLSEFLLPILKTSISNNHKTSKQLILK